MPDEPTLLGWLMALGGAALQLSTAGVAIYGAVRCMRLQRFGTDRRLKVLAAFFALFAGALILQAAWQVEVGAGPPAPGFGTGPWHGTGNMTGAVAGGVNATAMPRPHDGLFGAENESGEHVTVLLVTSHALMLASLVVAVWAFGHRRPAGQEPKVAAALAPLTLLGALFGTLLPLMLALEAGLTLYLAARALVNHVERRSAGALQVALGFLLFFAAHLVIYLSHQPGAGHDRLGDVLGLVGIVLLVQALPGRR